MDLNFKIKNQTLERIDENKIVNLSENYLKLNFDFTTTDWGNKSKFILFKHDGKTTRMALDNDIVIVPASLLKDKIVFSVYGVDGEDENYIRITTNLVRLNLLNSGYTTETDDPLPSEPDIVEEIYIAIASAEVSAKNYTDVGLSGKADLEHTHTKSDITDFSHNHDDRYYTESEVDELIYDIENKLILTALNLIQTGKTMILTSMVKVEGFAKPNLKIDIEKQGDGSLAWSKIGEATTDSNGVAEYTYTGVGSGNIKFRAKYGNLVSEPYEVLDCTYIDADPITSVKTYNVDIGSTAFAFEFDINLSANNSQGYFRIGTDNNNCFIVGAIYSTQQGIRVMSGGSDIDHIYCSTRIPVGTTTTIKFTYNNGVMTYSDGDETITITDNTITPSKLLTSGLVTSTISNVRVYPI